MKSDPPKIGNHRRIFTGPSNIPCDLLLYPLAIGILSGLGQAAAESNLVLHVEGQLTLAQLEPSGARTEIGKYNLELNRQGAEWNIRATSTGGRMGESSVLAGSDGKITALLMNPPHANSPGAALLLDGRGPIRNSPIAVAWAAFCNQVPTTQDKVPLPMVWAAAPPDNEFAMPCQDSSIDTAEGRVRTIATSVVSDPKKPGKLITITNAILDLGDMVQLEGVGHVPRSVRFTLLSYNAEIGSSQPYGIWELTNHAISIGQPMRIRFFAVFRGWGPIA